MAGSIIADNMVGNAIEPPDTSELLSMAEFVIADNVTGTLSCNIKVITCDWPSQNSF
jgi:hypothetical protein